MYSCSKVREYLEKHYEETSGDETAKLALKALTETVEASAKNIEVAVTTKAEGVHPSRSTVVTSTFVSGNVSGFV